MLELSLNYTETAKYYECSDFPFNFNLLLRKPVVASDVEARINGYLSEAVPEGRSPNWVVF